MGGETDDLLDALREISVVRALSDVDERFGFAHQILDGVAPNQMVRSLALVHPSEAQYDIDHVAWFFFAVLVVPPHVCFWRISQRALQGASVHVVSRIAVVMLRVGVRVINPLAWPATDRAVPGPFFPQGCPMRLSRYCTMFTRIRAAASSCWSRHSSKTPPRGANAVLFARVLAHVRVTPWGGSSAGG